VSGEARAGVVEGAPARDACTADQFFRADGAFKPSATSTRLFLDADARRTADSVPLCADTQPDLQGIDDSSGRDPQYELGTLRAARLLRMAARALARGAKAAPAPLTRRAIKPASTTQAPAPAAGPCSTRRPLTRQPRTETRISASRTGRDVPPSHTPVINHQSRDPTTMTSPTRFISRPAYGILAAAVLAFTATPAAATFRGDFELDDLFPDLFTDSLSLSYTTTDSGATGSLAIDTTGTTGTWRETEGSTALVFTNMDFLLEANFTNSGSVFTGGTVSIINRGFNQLGIPDDTVLLDGTIFDFAIDDTPGTESFFFRLGGVTSEAAGTLGWDAGRQGQVIIAANGFSDPNWAGGDLSFTASATADSYIPAPAPVALLTAGLAAIGWLRRRRTPAKNA
jgi:hypothetical protein